MKKEDYRFFILNGRRYWGDYDIAASNLNYGVLSTKNGDRSSISNSSYRIGRMEGYLDSYLGSISRIKKEITFEETLGFISPENRNFFYKRLEIEKPLTPPVSEESKNIVLNILKKNHAINADCAYKPKIKEYELYFNLMEENVIKCWDGKFYHEKD